MEKITADKHGIFIKCPNCDYWETLGLDDPRKRLELIPIIEWKEDADNQNEVSINQCTGCNTTFELEWDYENSIIKKYSLVIVNKENEDETINGSWIQYVHGTIYKAIVTAIIYKNLNNNLNRVAIVEGYHGDTLLWNWKPIEIFG